MIKTFSFFFKTSILFKYGFHHEGIRGGKKKIWNTFISNFPAPVELLSPTDRVKIGLEYSFF